MFPKLHCLENKKMVFSPFFYCLQNKKSHKENICFPIFPTSPARAQDTKICPIFFLYIYIKNKMLFGNLIMICRQRLCFSARLKNRGFRVREIEIQWHKSKETPRTDPENTGSKKTQIFWFSLGVLYVFSRKSNEDEFSRKSNGGWIFLGIKRGLQKK